MSIPKNDELIESLFHLASEKNLNTTLLLKIVEDSIRDVVRQTKGDIPIDIKIDIDTKTICTYVLKEVCENPVGIYEISLENALKMDPGATIGDQVRELVGTGFSSMPFMRTAIESVKKLLREKILNLEKEREYAVFADKENTMIVARVKSMAFGNVILDIKDGEGYMPSSEIIPGETFRINQKVRAYIYQVRRNHKGPQVMLSRKHPGLLECLLEEAVPEINDRIFIKAVAREAGSKSKVAVISEDPDVDPIGSCIGKGGLRIKTVMQELGNEKIDIVHWSEDLVTLVMNAIYPAEVVKVIVKGENEIELIVKDDHMHIAIGRDGQNVRLARKLAKCKLKISSETDYEQEKVRLENKAIEEFKSIGMNDADITLFIEEGILSCEMIKDISPEEILEIEGISLSEEQVKVLISKAEELCAQMYRKVIDELGSKIKSFDKRISVEEIAILAQHGILTNQDVANLDTYEMIEMMGDRFVKEEIDEIIMNFRRESGLID